MLYKKYILLFFALLFSCAPQMRLQKNTLFVSPLLDPVDICREGLCILPFWDEQKDTLLYYPTLKQMEKLTAQRGHRQLKIVSFEKIYKQTEKKTGDGELLLKFEKAVFAGKPVELPPNFPSVVKCGYFLRLSFGKGEILKNFNRTSKVSVTFYARLYQIASKNIIWEASVLCSGNIETITQETAWMDPAIISLIELLPVNPKISYIKPKDEIW
jgi:hypothetical protein